jgi:hypothetical protein
VSIDEVASSRISTGGSKARARAKESNCFSPTDSPAPRSRTCAAYPSGSREMKRSACTLRAAVRIVSGEMPGSPREMLSAMLPVKRKKSCCTMAKRRRNCSSG